MSRIPFVSANDSAVLELAVPVQQQNHGLDLNQFLIAHHASTFLLRMQGNRLGVGDGDILVVDRSLTPNSGNLVIAIVENDLALLRYPVDEIWGVVKWVIRQP